MNGLAHPGGRAAERLGGFSVPYAQLVLELVRAMSGFCRVRAVPRGPFAAALAIEQLSRTAMRICGSSQRLDQSTSRRIGWWNTHESMFAESTPTTRPSSGHVRSTSS
jgi:hypothetical protein